MYDTFDAILTFRFRLLSVGTDTHKDKTFYLDDTHARVQEYGSFGLLGDLVILVEVQVVGAVAQLCQVEIPPLERLESRIKFSRNKQIFFKLKQREALEQG